MKKEVYKTGDSFLSNEGDEFVVVQDMGWDNVLIRFKSGYEQSSTRQQIMAGSVKDRFKRNYFGVGFLGGKKYKTKGSKSLAYGVWKLMLERCYGNRDRHPNYLGCSVCEEWHNYQNFAEWYLNNHPNDGRSYDVDKDLLFHGNKIYSPETCLIMPHQENCEISSAKTYKMRSPDGRVVEIYNMGKFCRDHGLTRGNMHSVFSGVRKHHKGWTAL